MRTARRRLRHLTASDRRRPARKPPTRPLLAVALGLATALLVGGWPGLGAGAGLAAVAYALLRRLEPAGARRERLRSAADLPLAADLLAAVLRAGAPPADAVREVGLALGGPLGERLRQVALALRLGAAPGEAWTSALAGVPGGDRLASSAARSSASGAALAGALSRFSAELRADAASARSADTHRAGVLIVLPLGLCFLPAFVLAGLVPVLVAFFEGIYHVR